MPRPSLRRSLAASSWCQGVQLGASLSMMEITLLMMRLPLSVCSMTACFSDSAKSVWAVWSGVVCCAVAIICSKYRDKCLGCQGGIATKGTKGHRMWGGWKRFHPHPQGEGTVRKGEGTKCLTSTSVSNTFKQDAQVREKIGVRIVRGRVDCTGRTS